jgi:hypothetical protein
VFFSDASGGMNGAGIARLADLDRKGAVAGAISADSAPIGNSRALYHDGILSHVNDPTSLRGGRVGMELKDFIEILIEGAKRYRAFSSWVGACCSKASRCHCHADPRPAKSRLIGRPVAGGRLRRRRGPTKRELE